MEKVPVLRSSIHRHVLEAALFRGTVMGGLGAIILILTGIFFPPDQLVYWGFLIFILAMTLITWGLLPYRRLKRLETQPDLITFTESADCLLYMRRGNGVQIPLNIIQDVQFQEGKRNYGIVLQLKVDLTKDGNKSFFFPYFSQRSFEELKSFLEG